MANDLDYNVYFVKLPDHVREAVSPCYDGTYTIYLDEDLDAETARELYEHAKNHVERGDFDNCGNIQEIESKAHK